MSKFSDVQKKARRNDLADDLKKTYGEKAVTVGNLSKELNVIPTGSLALDFALGTGGWPRGHISGVFGPRDIGKSSVIGFNALKNAQRMGLICAWIAVEPWFDEDWARRHGVDPDEILLVRPGSAEKAFGALRKICASGAVDLVIFDSVGGLLSESEIDEEKGKPRMAGQAPIITWGMKAIAQDTYDNDVAVIMLNQVRHVMDSRMPGVQYQQPGGEALEHYECVIVQLKYGEGYYTIKEPNSKVVIGREIKAVIHRNKLNEGSNQVATFDFYSKQTEEYPFGIDVTSDVINTSMRCGVIKRAGAYYDLPDGKRVQGNKAVGEYLSENPKVMEQVREGVLQKMIEMKLKKGGKVILTPEPEDESGS